MKDMVKVWVIAAILGSGSLAFAEGPDFTRDVLRPIDSVPTAVWLDANFEDAQGKLIEAANSATDSYDRQRAITLLSLYPNARTRAALQKLVLDGDPAAKELAVYTLGRTYGSVADDELVRFLSDTIAREEGRVAHWATRALRWVAHPDAKAQLERLAGGDDATARIARRALRLHVLGAATGR